MDDKGFFREIIDIYIQRFDIKENTKRSYGKMLAQFAEFADGLPNLPTRQDVMAYREQLKSRLRAASVQKHIVVIRGFYRWYYIEGFGPNAAEGVKGMKIESDFKRESLSLEAAIKLLNRAKRYANKNIIGKRDHALIALLLTTGLRTIEVERATKILNIPEPEIYITSEENLCNREITGYYSFEMNEIVFNEDWISRSTWIEVMITSIHETRHAYQGYCIRTKSRESLETLDKWEYETLNYIMPSGKNNEIDDEDYLKQEIEIDAIAFAHRMMLEHFGLKTVLPISIRESVIQRI